MSQTLIAELTNKNAELTARLSLALHQVEAVSQLAAGLAHDFRNALQVVLGEAEFLASAVQDPDLLESAKAVLLAGSHADAISKDLLALARRAQTNVGVVDSAELLSRCQRLIQGIVQKRASCVFTVDPNIGAVAVEPQRLEAALINLSANARDAMPKGGQLRVSGFNVGKGTPLPPELPAGEYVAFSVEDTGTGMSPEVLARATEAFFTTKDPEHGTGLGLAMVSAFAARSGGALRIESEVGRGTRVEIFLPRARLSTDPPPEPQFPAVAFDRLLKRVHTEWLSELLRAWRNSCPEKGLPHLADFEGALRGRSDYLLLVAVDRVTSPPALRLVRMGDGLTRALQRTALGMLPDDALEPAGTLRAAYGRALDSRFPTYERAQYSLGDGPSTEIERLILPASLDGETVSHLLGVIVLPQNLQAEGVWKLRETRQMTELAFDAADLVARVAALDAPALDSLPFGVIRLDRDGKVTFFSRTETRQSGFGDRPALGRTFFTEIAPCMGSPELLRRIESARVAGTLDILFEQVGDFEDATRELRVRIKSAAEGGLWVFIERRN